MIGIYNKEIEDAVRGLQPLYEEAIKASVDEERCEDGQFRVELRTVATKPCAAA